mgnify:CR=1 FL=1
MNLLPAQIKSEIEKERHRRFIFVLGMFGVAALAVSIVLLLPSFFMFSFQEKYLNLQLASVRQNSELEKAEEIGKIIEDLNKKSELVRLGKARSRPSSFYLVKIVELMPVGVSLNTFNFGRNKEKGTAEFSLQGTARERDDLLAFVKKLEDGQDFLKVVSPVSNLLAEKNFNFSLILELKDHD